MNTTTTTKPNTEQLIQEYFKKAKLMQLATVSSGKPWVSNVWFVADKDMNIYWFSSITRRHSIEVMRDSHVSAAICLPQTPADSPRGVQLEGSAELVTKPSEVAIAMGYFIGRIFSIHQIKYFMADKETPHRFYKIKPTSIVLFDAVNFPDQPKQEYVLDTKNK